MLIKCELDIQVSMEEVNTLGTSCQGYLPKGTRYIDIDKVFGEPQSDYSIDGKTKCEWSGKINGLVFTIYDYKSPLDPHQNTEWHIGGKIKLTAELVNIYFKAKQ